jgi:hypothetical protein
VQAGESGDLPELSSSQKQSWAKRQEELAAEAKLLNDVSKEYYAHGSIKIAEHRESTSADTWNEAVSKSFYEKYQKGRVTTPKQDPLSKTSVAASPRGKVAHHSHKHSSSNSMPLLGAKFQDQVGLWCEEEQQLLSAFCSVYGPDVQTVARLLCRGTSTGEISQYIDKACDDTRCEVCHSPERGNEMILCDKCNLGFHTFCLNPPLDKIPDDDWYCEDCVPPPLPRGRSKAARQRAMTEEECKAEEETGRSIMMDKLEKQASDELQASFCEVHVQNVLDTLAADMRKYRRRVRLRDVQTANYTTTFGVFLLTAPVPIRNEQVSSVLIPLRRHLRIVAHAVIESFNNLDIINVREIIRVQREKKALKDKALPPGVPTTAAPNDGFGAHRAWILQINPQFGRIEACKRPGAELSWFARQHASLIREGDKVYLWKGGHVSVSHGDLRPRGGGVIATGIVTVAPHQRPDNISPALDALLVPSWRNLVTGVDSGLLNFKIVHVMKPMLTCRALQGNPR